MNVPSLIQQTGHYVRGSQAELETRGLIWPQQEIIIASQGAGANQKSTVAIETLRPKLQRTPHQQLPPRRPACTSGRENIDNEGIKMQ
ncbi:hypothetical protein QQP08_014314 [Theobroma cacao]|nr:hypothetical protein QQP08_014314 [Theobroma cacao]